MTLDTSLVLPKRGKMHKRPSFQSQRIVPPPLESNEDPESRFASYTYPYYHKIDELQDAIS